MSTPEILFIPHELDEVTNQLDERIETLAHGSEKIQNAALLATKYIFDLSLGTERDSKPSIDDLLSSLNPIQKPQTRSQAKANDVPSLDAAPANSFEPTPISSLFIENTDAEQLWMQLDLRAQTICDLLEFALETGRSEEELSGEEDEGDEEDNRLQLVMEAIENGEEIDFDALEDELGGELDMEDTSSGESDEEGDNIADEEEDIIQLRSPEGDRSGSEVKGTLFDVKKSTILSKKKKGTTHGLNDDFFDLDAFNAETEQTQAKSSSRGRLAVESDGSEDESMSVDLFATLDEEEETAAVDIFYSDFFELPKTTGPQPRAKGEAQSGADGRVRFDDEVRVKKIKAKGKNLPLSFLYGNGMEEEEEEEDEDEGDWGLEEDFDNSSAESGSVDDSVEDDDDVVMEENEGSEDNSISQGIASEGDDDRTTIERLKDDLFADDDDNNDNDDMTTHERRQAALREQIAQLEAENVAKKDWTLMGEADVRSRPQNSLLEEDLEFERAMKPVPVISEDVVQGLEQRIKARISENHFDDVVRIRPLEDKPFLPSRLLELQDTKSAQSLAQSYENDYLASQGGAADNIDGKLKKEHGEIELQWEKVCSKLDALCNAHFVPKQPKAVISTVSNVATASMESALPTAKATSSILAPEEVFNPASSETRSRSELSPTEKRALRSKERKLKKKQRQMLEKGTDKVAKMSGGISGVKKEKQAALQNIVKSGKGVTVVGKQAKGLPSTKKRNKS